jgi:ribosomal protein S18 acetylase RimI-like enzyme
MKFKDYLQKKEIVIIVKSPQALSDDKINDFVDVVKEGDQIDPVYLKGLVKKCKLLGIAYNNNEPIATIGIKNPYKSYKENVFRMADVLDEVDDYKYEMGYLYIKPKYRITFWRSGIVELFDEILEKIDGKIYGTVRANNKNVLSLFQKMGFKQLGNDYNSSLGSYKLKLQGL